MVAATYGPTGQIDMDHLATAQNGQLNGRADRAAQKALHIFGQHRVEQLSVDHLEPVTGKEAGLGSGLIGRRLPHVHCATLPIAAEHGPD